MSNEIKSCHICDTPSNCLCICDICLHPCCEFCIDEHKTDKICQLITEHVNNFSNVCKHHNGRVYTGYCLKCSKQTCEQCKDSHADHLTSILSLKLAMEPIQKRLHSCKTLFSKNGQDTKNLIHSSTEEIKKLRNVREEIENGGMEWKRLISDIKEEFLKQVSSHISKLDGFCDKGYGQQSLMNEMINKVDSLENVQYIWTFYPIWLAIIEELESVVKLERISKRGSFSIILQNALPDLSDCLIETREYNALMKEKEPKLDSDALKLGNEIEKYKLATKDLEKKIRENELIKSDICKQLAENKLLFDSHQTMLVENEIMCTKIETLEKVKIELKESLINNQTMLVENERMRTTIFALEKQKMEMNKCLGNHQTIVDKNERMGSKIEALEKQITEMKESLSMV
ncbi:uncharacterized protein LOC143043024 [Mytilus galloprovincialis]|uniref:uncharacterized protein LOC143043024 n=1 Tax=Mytilus galloprovincialis TaxID=29158 RepID=UPI003F7B97A3